MSHGEREFPNRRWGRSHLVPFQRSNVEPPVADADHSAYLDGRESRLTHGGGKLDHASPSRVVDGTRSVVADDEEPIPGPHHAPGVDVDARNLHPHGVGPP